MVASSLVLSAFIALGSLAAAASSSSGTTTTSDPIVVKRHSKSKTPAPSLPRYVPGARTYTQATRADIVARDAYFKQFGAYRRQTSTTPNGGCADSSDPSSTTTAGEYQGYAASYSSGDAFESTSTSYASAADCGTACLNDDYCTYANFDTSTNRCDFYTSLTPDTLTATPGIIAYVYDQGSADSCTSLATEYGLTATCCNFHYGDTYDPTISP